MVVCGIDYGSKMAGTTVVCLLEWETGKCEVLNSVKKQDADLFVYRTLATNKVQITCIDAPLSLPGVYRWPGQYSDYFFRQADKELQAMSPMFLGGLTARAIKLKSELELVGIQVYETYPTAQARRLNLHTQGYKEKIQDIPAIASAILMHCPQIKVYSQYFTSWHQVDALLALMAAIRWYTNKYDTYGEQQEGLIMV